MLRLPLELAQPGMVLAMPVFHPSLPGHVLLRPGFSLDEPALKRIRELRIGQLWIRYPALESVVRFVCPDVTMEHAALTSLIGRTIDRIRDPRFTELDFKVYADAVRSMLARLTEHNEAAMLINDVVGGETPLAMHSGSVCFVSLLMGLKLEHYLIEQRPKMHPRLARGVENLGVGALLHDIGIQRLRPEVVERWQSTGDSDEKQFQRHVQLGYEFVRGRVEPTASATILHHHQRYDGSGYPKIREREGVLMGLRGEEIHIFARILNVADVYDELRNPPHGCWRDDARVPVVRVLRRMLDLSRQGTIDPIVFKALLHVVPAFAPGTIVRLSNGQQAAVLDFDPHAPCRPRVQHLRHVGVETPIDPDALREVYDLRVDRTLRVVGAEGYDVRDDLFDAANEEEFDLSVTRKGPRRLAA